MEDKTIEFLEKMYADLKNEIKSVKEELKTDIQTVSNQVTKLENTLTPKVESLFDGYKQVVECQEDIRNQLGNLASRVESQDVQITVLKGGKQATR